MSKEISVETILLRKVKLINTYRQEIISKYRDSPRITDIEDRMALKRLDKAYFVAMHGLISLGYFVEIKKGVYIRKVA